MRSNSVRRILYFLNDFIDERNVASFYAVDENNMNIANVPEGNTKIILNEISE